MYATTHHPPTATSQIYRWAGRVFSVALFVMWAAFVAFEAARPAVQTWPVGVYLQAAALAVVFLGYAVGWKRELFGAVLVGVGALAYLVITLIDTKTLPGIATVWFLTPGILYLFARHYERIETRLRAA
jgi:hypothetical protein